jgi:hypothetical protein
MKALKSITIKIENTFYDIAPGNTIPAEVESFWKANNQISELVKAGSISENSATEKQPESTGQNEKK